ncbi:uncharacterized protein LAJ45_08378 [Morchella importuna]|uniref:uncharacterized protein n=1 Tax=Morchella importuna TaxID=1174673 RepID=UPI001E8E15AD|nr:uncharacterized protein LAJ45_08378 [Morchella importuna]KAH8147551.1 hypothetical protein LAJ45_08378 [Morchella importuna]
MSDYTTEVAAILAAARARAHSASYEHEPDQEDGDAYNSDNDVDQTRGASMPYYASEEYAQEEEEQADGGEEDAGRYAHNEVLARALGVPDDTTPIPAQGLFFTQTGVLPLVAGTGTGVPAQGLFFVQAGDSAPPPLRGGDVLRFEDDEEEEGYGCPPTPDLEEYDSGGEEGARPRWGG